MAFQSVIGSLTFSSIEYVYFLFWTDVFIRLLMVFSINHY